MASKRSVVVTGSGSGIGFAIANRLARDGWSVVGLELDPAGAERLEKSLGVGHAVMPRTGPC
jgi:NAD(P)-dependent dehydrogenase (short-subunit alcohol dehydrogenase family)